MPESDRPLPPIGQSKAVGRKQTRLSAVWVVPIVAALVGVWVAVAKIRSEGPTITIVFPSAEGLEAGKTKIHYNGVDVGTLTTVRLSDDHQRVIATAQMAPRTEDFLVADTRFWVVRPRISGANVTGLGTLISGAYVGMEIGHAPERRRDFVALASAPVVAGDMPGRFFVLKSSDLGSLDYGTPLYFRRLQVGEVTAYELDQDGQGLTVKVFVNAPYDRFVSPDTRFWHASGIDMSLSASGLSLQTQSALSILVGGVAFETPTSDPALPPADADSVFTLFSNRAQAFKPSARDPQTYLLVLRQSVRGLVRGAPVDFRGIQIGEVAEVQAEFDAQSFDFSVLVTIHVDPAMFGVGVAHGASDGDILGHRKVVDALVARGLRAQLRTGSMLTGALYVALDFFPDAAPVAVDWFQRPVHLETVPGELEGIEASIVRIVKKLERVPIQAIGDDLAKAIARLDRTLADADKLIEPGAGLGAGLESTLLEVTRAARGLRVLADYLERHPEALIRGKTGEAK